MARHRRRIGPKPFGVTTPRVDSLGPQSPSDFPSAGHSPESDPAVEVVDAGKRSESVRGGLLS